MNDLFIKPLFNQERLFEIKTLFFMSTPANRVQTNKQNLNKILNTVSN